MGSTTKQATSTSTSSPWAEQKPYLQYGMQQAKDLYQNQTPKYFPGSTVAGFSPEQQQAQQLGTARATQGNAGMGMAQGYNNDVLQGKYLNSNPYQDAVFGNIQSHVLPSVNSQFSGAGRYGSNSHQNTAIDQLTSAYAPYASQNYQYGLGQMDAAANRAPQFAANDYQDINALSQIGQQKQTMGQNELTDAVNRYNFYQDLPANQLGQYMGFVGGNYGGTTTSQTPYQQPSIWSQLGGAALSAGGLAGSLGLLSDVRAKKNIRRVGTLDNGIPIYAYQYKGQHVTQLGVIAQEVENTHPQAVYTNKDGVKYVNYETLVNAA